MYHRVDFGIFPRSFINLRVSVGRRDGKTPTESLEEYTTAATYNHPLVTPPKDQGANVEKSDGSLLELVRPVLVTDQTSLTRGQRKESKKYS